MIRGTTAGLSGSGLILEMNDGSDLPVETNGAFRFPAPLPAGTAYNVRIKYQPAATHEICSVTNGSGVIGNEDISNLVVDCTIAAGFVYVVDPGSQIAVYGITPGTGAPISAGTFAATPTIYGIVAAPSGNYLYVLSRQPDRISTFAIDPNHGGLTEIQSVATGSGPYPIVMSADGSFVFVGDMGTNAVQSFTVDSSTGALTAAGTLQLPSYAQVRFPKYPYSELFL